MFKIAGAISVFLSSALFGFVKSQRLKKRRNSLERLSRAFERIAAETSFTKKRIERIFAEIAREYELPVLADTAFSLQRLGVKTAWKECLEKYAEEMALTPSDVNIALALASLGDYTGAEQQKSILSAQNLLKLSCRDADALYSKNARLYRSCGVLFGLLAVILLI